MDTIKLDILRYSSNNESTLGLLFMDNEFFCYTLEDEFRIKKVKGETRIPEGTYELTIRQEVSGLTKRYRDRYSWFDKHIMLKDVPGFNYIYIHIGNDDDDSDGCILLGSTINNNKVDEGFVGNSRLTFKSFYRKVYSHLDKGGRVVISIKDVDRKL
jgi:hypothetical protein